jgi:hypothetical protein
MDNYIGLANPIAGLANQVTKSSFAQTTSPPAPTMNMEVKHDTFSNIIGNIICLIALYFAFKCKTPTGGVDFLQLLLAACCSPCFIVYRLVVPCKGI